MISMYDPEYNDMLADMMAMFPEELINALNFNLIGTDLTAFLGSYIYGFLIFLFPMIFVIIVNNRLIAKHVSNGSMVYLLSVPTSRKKVVVTQAIFSIAAIFTLLMATTVFTIVISAIMAPGELKIGQFLFLNGYTLTFYFCISGITFFASTVFNDTSRSLALGAGLPVAFFVLNMLANAAEGTAWAKNLTLFTLYDLDKFFAGNAGYVIISSLVFVVLGFLLYGTGSYLFIKKDLSI